MADGFFTTSTHWEALVYMWVVLKTESRCHVLKTAFSKPEAN